MFPVLKVINRMDQQDLKSLGPLPNCKSSYNLFCHPAIPSRNLFPLSGWILLQTSSGWIGKCPHPASSTPAEGNCLEFPWLPGPQACQRLPPGRTPPPPPAPGRPPEPGRRRPPPPPPGRPPLCHQERGIPCCGQETYLLQILL